MLPTPPAKKRKPKREHHLDEQLGLLVGMVFGGAFLLTFCILLFTAGWYARGRYKDHQAQAIIKRLCEEGVLCAELAD